METARKSLINLIIGIWIIMILIAAVGSIFFSPLPFLCGELFGSCAATGLVIHMYHSLDIELDIGERAVSHARRAAFFRSVSMLAVLFLAFYFRQYIHPLGAFLGLFGMKLSVYVQPIITKIFKGRRTI